MITYSTVLQTQEQFTGNLLLRTILASSNKNQVDVFIEFLPAIGVRRIQSKHSGNELVIVRDNGDAITAIRYQRKRSNGSVLFMEYVLDESARLLFVRESIQGLPGVSEQAENRVFKAPKLIRQFIDGELLAPDYCFPISYRPMPFTEENSDMILSLKNGGTHCQLPIVCISSSRYGGYPVSVDKVAIQLAGLAHVVTLEDRIYRSMLTEGECKRSKYQGSISVFYPETKCFTEIKCTNKKRDSISQLLKEVLSYRMKQTALYALTFEQVYDKVLQKKVLISEQACQEAQLAQNRAEMKYEQLLAHLDEETDRLNKEAMDRALQEAEQIVSEYEEDIEGLKEDLYEKNLYLQGMEVENKRLRSHLDQGKIPVIYLGHEKEFYLGEIQDLLLSTLEEALDGLPSKSRKRDVITDILNSNNYKHTTRERSEQVKSLLKDYDGMSAKVRHGLKNLGFQIEETNKHCKISYHGDNRYMVVLGNTPSDFRSGKNNAATVARMAY